MGIVQYIVFGVILMVSAGQCLSQGWSPNVSPIPKPSGPIGDYAEVIDPATEAEITQKIQEFFERTGVALAVATVKTTGERDIFDYSLAVARGWGIGMSTDDNPGALLFVAVDDRKYFTQISKDLEDELPDGLAGNIQRQYLVPEFRKGNYGKGISDTIDAYIAQIEGRTSGFNPPVRNNPGEDDLGDAVGAFVVLGIILFLILLFASRVRTRNKSKDDHDRWGGGGGISDALPWIIIGGSGGSSSDSSSSWSDWGSGSSDWGGFGGGGDFGGGGAGGGW